MLYSLAVGGLGKRRTVPEICYLVKAGDPLSQHVATNRRAFVKSLSDVYSYRFPLYSTVDACVAESSRESSKYQIMLYLALSFRAEVVKKELCYFDPLFKKLKNIKDSQRRYVDRLYHFLKSVGIFRSERSDFQTNSLATRNVTQGERAIHRSSFHILVFFPSVFSFFFFDIFFSLSCINIAPSATQTRWKTRNAFNFVRSRRVKERAGTS